MTPQISFILGLIISPFLRKKPAIQNQAKKWMTTTLQVSVVLQGATLDINRVLVTGKESFILTLFSILAIFIVGFLGAKLLKVRADLAQLITMGTAICGGSAIAALAPVIEADSIAIGLSLALVFSLNIVAIYLFPILGHFFGLSQSDFGMWSALSIHDTSSVTAAALSYGQEALSIATTIKLTRALWIIPVTLAFSIWRNGKAGKVKIPWFIGGFILASILFSHIPFLHSQKEMMGNVSKAGFGLTLFLLGISFDLKSLKTLSIRPVLFGVLLWILVSASALILVRQI